MSTDVVDEAVDNAEDRLQRRRSLGGWIVVSGFLPALFILGALILGYSNINAFFAAALIALAAFVAGFLVMNWRVAVVVLPIVLGAVLLVVMSQGPLASWLLERGINF